MIRNSDKEREMLFNIVENSADPIVCVDLYGIITYWNRGAEEFFGYKKGEIIGQHFYKIVPGEFREEIERVRKEAAEKGFVKNYETYRTRKNGKKIPVNLTLTALKEGEKVVAICGIFKDLSERKKLEDRLKESKNFLETILDAMQEAIIVLDRDYSIVSYNKAFFNSLKLKDSSAGILGEKCYKVLHGYSYKEYETFCKEKCIVKTCFETGESVEDIHKHEENGNITYHYARAIPLTHDSSKVSQVLYLFSDFTDKKRTEEELKKNLEELKYNTRLRQLFSDILTHDLINPLTVVKNTFEIVAESEGIETKREVAMINKNIEKMQEIIENAALFARMEKKEDLKSEDMDLVPVLKDAIDILTHFAEAKNMKVSLEAPPSVILKVKPFIEHVFLNLISNAIKYAPENTEIKVCAEESDKAVKVSVKDRGSGVPDAYKELIFERFKKLEKKGVKGTGLGLAIVKQIAEINQGKAWVEDNPGGGSIFCVEIPKH